MGDGKDSTFSAGERGIGNRLTGANRLTHDLSAAALSARDAADARKALDLHNRFRADPPQLIDLAKALQKVFEAGANAPLTRRATATELLRVYRQLQDFESSNTPRGPGGSLQYKDHPWSPRLKPWTKKHPRSVGEIPPFSARNVHQWRAVVGAGGPPLPAPSPPTAPPPRPKPAAAQIQDRFGIQIIKMPGMTLTTKAGQTQVLASVIRVLSRQAISDPTARSIAQKLDFSKYRVLDFEDTVEHAANVFEDYSVGSEYTVKLKNEILDEVKRATPVPLEPKQRLTRYINDSSSESFPDFTSNERLLYVLNRVRNGRSRDQDSGHWPGEIVSADMVMFVGPQPGVSLVSLYWSPDGRLYEVPQKSLRQQQLDAVIKGFASADGAVTLGVAIFVAGAAAVLAPEVIAALATAVEPVFVVGTGLYESVVTSSFASWMGMHAETAIAAGFAGLGLATKVVNFDPAAWVKEFRENPAKALEELIVSIAETAHDFFQLRMAVGARSTYSTSDPEPAAPSQVPSVSKPATRAAPPPDVEGSQDRNFWTNTATTTPNRLANRPPADRPVSNLTERRNRMTNPSTATAEDLQGGAGEVQPVRILRRTGTGGADVVDEDQTTGVTRFAPVSSSANKVAPSTPGADTGGVTPRRQIVVTSGGSSQRKRPKPPKAGRVPKNPPKSPATANEPDDPATPRMTQGRGTGDKGGGDERQFQQNLARLRVPPRTLTRVKGKLKTTTDCPPELIEAVRSARAKDDAVSDRSFGSNYAAFEVEVQGEPKPRILAQPNTPHTMHSEGWLTGAVEKITGDPKFLGNLNKATVTHVFSEREPCAERCSRIFRARYPLAKIHFLVSAPPRDLPATKALCEIWIGKLPRE
jgi:hypothetical protein